MAKEEQPIKEPKYTPEELSYLSELKQQLEKARNQRDAKHPEFDEQDYLHYYETNAKAANSYVPPKEYESDTRIVTGTTEEKEQTLLSSLLNYNFEPNIMAFDKENNLLRDWGEIMEDMLNKSREIEEPMPYEFSKMLYYKEGLDQGNAFVEDLYFEKIKSIKELKQNINWEEVDKIKWTERLEKVLGNCTTNLISGTKFYPGNIREFFIQNQPFIFTVEIMPYSLAKLLFSKWERWKYVPENIKRVDEESADIIYRDWTLTELEDEMVEIIKYQNKPANEFQILLNGVMMLPIGFPLTAISSSGEYTISKFDAQPISKFFFYSKSIPAKTKVMQAVFDEMLKLMILKTQQSYKPPLANTGRMVVSRNVFNPGIITPGLDVNKLMAIPGTGGGITTGEINMFSILSELIDKRSTSPIFQGESPKGAQTLGEIQRLEQEGRRKMMAVILGTIIFEKQLAQLRIYNILTNWTKPIDQRVNKHKKQLVNIYRRFTIDTTLEEGGKAKRLIEFTDQEMPSDQQIKAEEDLFEMARGSRYRKNVINVKFLNEALREFALNWFISIEPTEKRTDQLDRELWLRDVDVLSKLEAVGKLKLNWSYITDQLAYAMKKDPDKLFLKEQQAQTIMPNMAQKPMGIDTGGQMIANMMRRPQMPSVNTMAGAV